MKTKVVIPEVSLNTKDFREVAYRRSDTPCNNF
jgi:hypothetical protein